MLEGYCGTLIEQLAKARVKSITAYDALMQASEQDVNSLEPQCEAAAQHGMTMDEWWSEGWKQAKELLIQITPDDAP
jgi:hypothetical protein